MTLTLVFKGFHVMEKQLRPALRERNPAECDQILKQMWRLALTGVWNTQAFPLVLAKIND
jgi:dihydroceramidase